MKQYSIGIDLGGTNLRAAIISKDGKIISRITEPTPSKEGGKAVFKRLIETIHKAKYIAREKNISIIGIGIGTPGTIDIDKGIVLGASSNIPGWVGTELKAPLEKEFNLPVSVDNDANVVALAEGRFGNAKGKKTFICITLGTGVGGGIVLDGKLWHGHSFSASEIGHMIIQINGQQCSCGTQGCLEAYTSAPEIVRQVHSSLSRFPSSILHNIDIIRAKDVFDAANQSDDLANIIVNNVAYYLATGIVNLLVILDPEMIILGGGIMQAGEWFLEKVKKGIRHQDLNITTRKTEIVLAKLGTDAGLIGAALLCF